MKTHAFCTLTALAVCAAIIGGCAPPQPSALLNEAELAAGDLELFWRAELPLDEKTDERVVRISYEPGFVYALTTDNRLLALDAFSGHFRWSAEIGRKSVPPSAIRQHGQVVFVAVLTDLLGFRTDDGSKILERTLDRAPSTPLAVHGEYLYYGTHDGWFEAINLLDSSRDWNRLTHAGFTAAPAFDGSKVYFANNAGQVFASNYSRRETLWTYEVNGAVVADVKRSGQGLILVASRDYVLYALNPITGQHAWMNITGDPLEQTPLVGGGQIYIIKKGDQLLTIDESDGQTQWAADGIEAPVAVSPLTLFARCACGRMAGFSVAGGRKKFALDTGRLCLAARNEIDGQVFLAGAAGNVVALRETKVDYRLPAAGAAEESASE
jgi:outer membrane protein assembly factor BamB